MLVRADPDAGPVGAPVLDLSAPDVSIRSRVHGYGGGAWCLVPPLESGSFAYVDAADQRVWLQRGPGQAPRPLTPVAPEGERWSHGGLTASADGAWVVGVREAQRADDVAPPRRAIVALDTDPQNEGAWTLAQGHDFYGAPRLDTATKRLAVAAWDHPDMQWDRSALLVIALDEEIDAAIGARRLVALGEPWVVEAGDDVSVGQPQWQRDGSLRFVTDRHGWWQPHVHSGWPEGGPAIPFTTRAAEFHGPDWALGQSTMAELPDGSLVARMTSSGRDSIVRLAPAREGREALDLVEQPCVSIVGVCAHGGGVALIGTPTDGPATVWLLRPPPANGNGHGNAISLRPFPPRTLGPADISVGEPFSFAGRSGRQIHGLFYEPVLQGTLGPPGELPPLLVHCHAGPTGSVSAGFDVVIEYFTSRGFAVAAVDYAGSTGYGREYRCSLWGQWGVADSEDCVDAARHLVAEGRVDGSRVASRGSSSGGLTALNVLRGGGTFAAAVSWYGVTDLLGLAASTHDFEARYEDRLVGPLPECRHLYEARSPSRHAAELQGSILLLQGLEDVVVPPSQTESLRDALVEQGRHCEVRFFEAEGHGFRRAETVRAALEAELDFYRRVLSL